VVAEAGPIDGAPPAVQVVLIERVLLPRPLAQWQDRSRCSGVGLSGL